MSTTWLRDVDASARFPSLPGDLEADVAIVGGGLAGTAVAYFLAGEERRVVVVEKDTIAEGATARTTAFLTNQIDTDLGIFGRLKASLIWESGRWAIDAIERIAAEEGIECEFTRCPLYGFARSDEERKWLEEERTAALELGYVLELDDRDIGFPHHGVLTTPDQGKYHPLQFLLGLRDAAVRRGASFFESTEAEEIKRDDGRVVVTTRRGNVRASHVVVATYDPFHRPLRLFARKGMYKTYVLECDLPRGVLPEATFVDLAEPYHYLRVDRAAEGDRLIVGGEDHRVEIPLDEERSFGALRAWLEELLPGVALTVRERWTGPILETVDGLPHIGAMSDDGRELVAAGFSGTGMTYSLIAGRLVTDAIVGRDNEWSRVYDPRRTPTVHQLYRKGVDYTKVLVNGALRNLFRGK